MPFLERMLAIVMCIGLHPARRVYTQFEIPTCTLFYKALSRLLIVAISRDSMLSVCIALGVIGSD